MTIVIPGHGTVSQVTVPLLVTKCRIGEAERSRLLVGILSLQCQADFIEESVMTGELSKSLVRAGEHQSVFGASHSNIQESTRLLRFVVALFDGFMISG